MPRTIGLLGSIALLVSSITGPSLVIIPLLFQQAGWLTPLVTFAAIAVLSAAAALFLVEAMSSIEGNEQFQAAIEFTTIAHLFLGKRWHIAVQGLLYLAMQSLVVASLLESFQSMDDFLITVAHKTCAISFSRGWVCVDQMSPSGTSAFSGFILGSFGTLITMSLILPLSLVRLVDNIIFQIVSFITLLIITLAWIVIFAVSGLHTHPVPVIGRHQASVVGFVLSNFSFVTTIPAWVNNTHPSVDVRLAIWLSIAISCLIYIPVGWLGGLALLIPDNATLLQVFATDPGNSPLKSLARVSSYLFPLAVLITSIPVFTIVIRYNLLRGNICSNKTAIFWSAVFPWIIAMPFQTNDGITAILNWASLIFTSPANLLVPFILFVASKKYLASAVLDANIPLDTIPPDPTATPGPTLAPTENVPVVIITDSTDDDGRASGGGESDSDSTDETKTLMSRDSGESDRAATKMIPVAVKHRVSSPSKHRYYGQEIATTSGAAGESSSPASAGKDRPVLFLDTTRISSDLSSSPSKTTTSAQHHHRHHRQRSSLSVSLSRSHSITHSSNTGMDEFLLMSSPTAGATTTTSMSPRDAQPMRSAITHHSPRPSASSAHGSSAVGGVFEFPPPSELQAGGVPDAADVRLNFREEDEEEEEEDGEDSMADAAETPPSRFRAFPCLSDGAMASSPAGGVRSTHVSIAGCVVAGVLVLIAMVYDIVSDTR